MSAIARADCVANPLGADVVKPWQPFEWAVKSEKDYLDPNLNPSRDLGLSHNITQVGSGAPITYKAGGFWYGLNASGQPDGKAFCIRGAFPKTGTWQWTLTCKLRTGGVRPGTYDCSQDTLLNTSGQFTVAGEPRTR